MARTSNNRVIVACDPYCCLLPQCEALHTCCSGFRITTKMVLWPGCEDHARCRLYKKNMGSVQSVVKRRGYCCNLSAGIALNVRFPMNGMCAKNNTHNMWREQAIIKLSQRVISIVACCHSVKLCTPAARAFQSQQWYLIVLLPS